MYKTHSKNLVLILIGGILISGCAELDPLTEYTPVVDLKRTNSAKFENDLVECRNIAIKVEADYKKRQADQFAKNLMVGILAGAITGAVVGDNSNSIATGAAIGGVAGGGTNDYTYDLVKFGPRRIVDRCMNERNYAILNDIGRG